MSVMDQPQHMNALTLANQVRTAVSQWKTETGMLPLNEGAVRVANLLCDDDPGLLGRVRVDHLLMSIRSFGTFRAHRMIRVAQIAFPDKRLDALTWRQRYALATLLRQEASK